MIFGQFRFEFSGFALLFLHLTIFFCQFTFFLGAHLIILIA